MAVMRVSRLRVALLGVFALGLAVSISLAQTALAALVVAVVAPSRDAPRRRLAWPLGIPVAAFALWTLVSALASARPLESLVDAKSLLSLAALYAVVGALPDGRAARRFLTVLFVLVSGVAILAILQVAACPAAPPAVPLLGSFFRKCARARGFFSIYMTLAGVLLLVLLAVLPRLTQVAALRTWLAPAWLTGAAALALTYTRGAWVGFLLSAAGILVAGRRRVVALVALGAAVLLLLVVLPGVLDRVRTIGDATDPTTRDRLAMISAGLRMAREHPFTGVGPGQVKHLYPAYRTPEALPRPRGHLHNTPLQILVERGVPGLLAWLAIFGAFLIRATTILMRLPAGARDDRALVTGCLVALGGFLVAGLFEYNFGDTEVLLVATSLMALPFVVERDLASPGAWRVPDEPVARHR
jgi:O-antigen ligase